jgi:hypothetical protein
MASNDSSSDTFVLFVSFVVVLLSENGRKGSPKERLRQCRRLVKVNYQRRGTRREGETRKDQAQLQWSRQILGMGLARNPRTRPEFLSND